MPNWKINKGDVVHIGEPPHAEPYLVVTQPDEGRYCKVAKIPTHTESEEITVYLGRWAVPEGV